MNEKEYLAALFDKCIRFIKIRPRTEQEIRTFLQKRDEAKTIIEKTVTTLKNYKYIDDAAFIAWWIGQRSDFKPKSRFALKSELLQKGISKELIETFLEENDVDEVALAKKALSTRNRLLSRIDHKTRFKKAIEFLGRRGFSYTIAKKAFEEWQVME